MKSRNLHYSLSSSIPHLGNVSNFRISSSLLPSPFQFFFSIEFFCIFHSAIFLEGQEVGLKVEMTGNKIWRVEFFLVLLVRERNDGEIKFLLVKSCIGQDQS